METEMGSVTLMNKTGITCLALAVSMRPEVDDLFDAASHVHEPLEEGGREICVTGMKT